MFYLRLNKVKILNNREMFGKGEVQFMSFINTGEDNFPMLGEFFNTTDPVKRNQLIADAVSQVISSRIMTPVHHVKDKQQLTFGDTGYIIYKSNKIPQDFNWMLLAIEIDSKTRDNAALLGTVLTNDNISSITNNIATLTGSSSPVSMAIIELTELVANILVNLFKNDKDDQVGLFMSSFIKQEHYPHGRRDRNNVPDLTGNMFIDYTIFGFID